MVQNDPASVIVFSSLFFASVPVGVCCHTGVVENQAKRLANQDGQRDGDGWVLRGRHCQANPTVGRIGDFTVGCAASG